MSFLATLRAISTTAFLAGAGALATRRGIITDQGRRCLAELSMNLLMPALLFTSLIKCEDGEWCPPVSQLISECWYLFIFPLFVVSCGMALGKGVAVVTGCPASFSQACVGAVAFGNSTGLAITLLEVLSPELLLEGVVQVNPLKYLPVYLLLYPLLQWTLGSFLFGLYDAEKSDVDEEAPGPNTLTADLETQDQEVPPLPQDQEVPPLPALPTTSSLSSSIMRSFAGKASSLKSFSLQDLNWGTEPDMAPQELPHLACGVRSQTLLPSLLSEMSDMRRQISDPAILGVISQQAEKGSLQLPCVFTAPTPSNGNLQDLEAEIFNAPLPPLATVVEAEIYKSGNSSGSSKVGPVARWVKSHDVVCCSCWTRGFGTLRKVIRNALVPPVIGAALGMTVALIRPLQLLFVDVSGGDDATALSFAFKALLTIGSASVPVNMLVLGSNLAKGCNFKAVPLSTNVGIILMKTIVMPLVMALLIGFISRVTPATDPAVWLVAIVVSCTPTANNIMVMVELSGQNKESMTTSIFSQYIVAPFTLTLVLTTYMMLLQTSWYLG
ncbi:unnamed protein product [Polarella glacialis]|uniref:Uncharacterized protein n=1 Tax=Polarella glacialis TaxID=89957 RepID=A0A813KL03_POLGL|nr:unnamed protein product [Polarella glacialis]